MNYFVTGATGFIGGHLVKRLLARQGTVYALVRKGSEKKLAALRDRLGVGKDRLVSVQGDLSKPGLGVSKQKRAQLSGEITHVFHLAALYDIADEDNDAATRANVDGTRHAVQFAQSVGAKCFHHMSSIAA
ncbi:MAG: SDR family oxidoreductase, partial [Candidatus Hydrogenedentes bacterium]|nr:SDR family oxidoreductase [Candidatus Hydrogenedentota bacterium]